MRKLLFTAVLTYLVCNSLAEYLVAPFSMIFAQTTTITNTTTGATANNRNSSATADTTIKSKTPKIITTPQEDIPKMSLEERTRQAEVVIEGRITKRFFVPTHDGHYRVAVEVEVYKLFKGKGVKKHIIVLGNEKYKEQNYKIGKPTSYIHFPDRLEPYNEDNNTVLMGEYCLFFINANYENNYSNYGYPVFEFIKDWVGIYSMTAQVYQWQLKKENRGKKISYETIEKQTFKDIKTITKKRYKTIKRKHNNANLRSDSATAEPSVTYFTPELPAGMLDSSLSTFVIQGANFGNQKRAISFANANTGGYGLTTYDWCPIDPQFVTWTSSLITIQLPSRGYNYDNGNTLNAGLNKVPGTGPVVIFFPSPIYLFWVTDTIDTRIPYAISNFVDYPNYSEVHLYDTDSSGNNSDFTFVYDTAFYNNKLALAAFRRALNTWRTETGVRFTEECGGQPLCLNDGLLNKRIKVGFKKACFTYPGEAIAKTTIDVQECGGQFYIKQPTMIFADIVYCYSKPCGTNDTICKWSFANQTTECGAYNFEKTALHELGHLLQLDHVIDSTLMYWNSSPGIKSFNNITQLIGDPALTGVNYILTRDAALPNCDTSFAPIQILPTGQRPPLPGCTSLCPTPTLNTPIDFTATNNCTTFSPYTADLFGIATEQEVTLSLTTSLPIGYILTWSIDGATILSGTTTSSTLTVKWTNPGEKLISLNISNGNSCTTRQKVIGVHQIGNCQISGEAVESFSPPSNCVEDNGSLTLAIPYNGSFCYHYIVSRNNQIIYNQAITDSSVIYNQIINGSSDIYTLDSLTAGNYTVTLNDLATGCYIEQHFALPPANPLSVDVTEVAANYAASGNCNGAISVAALGGTAPYTYQWSNNSTTTVPHITGLCGTALGGTATYTVTVTDSGGCTATTTANVNGSWLISIHEALCNCDLLIAGNPVTDQVIATARLSTSSNTPPNSNAQVLLELYNSMGIKVATLYNGTLPVPSNEAQTYSVANLPNGLYYLRLRTCGNSKTKAIVIM